jgi:C1A family cysteine protease
VGFLPESYYPYQAKDQNCSLLEADNLLQKQLKKTSGCKYVESGNEKATTEALMEEGPLAVALDAGHLSFRFYKEGIYYEPECSASRLSHAVTLVGFGLNETNVVDVNGTETDLTTFWSIKNSWGTKWGEHGYFRIAKLGNNCGITSVSSFPIL